LSAEIIVITLGTVVDADFMQKVLVLVAIATIITVGVYGLVAGIVKLDDLGLHLVESGAEGSGREKLGHFILRAAPVLMKGLGIVGTIAMFLVGGGIVVHNVPPLYEAVHHLEVAVHGAGGFVEGVVVTLANGLVGVVVGGVIVGVVTLVNRLRGVESHA
jgi:predicted DNA repair protein MutK